ncbi:MAG: hypothetical protein AAB250_05615, partial [Bdellovibrionota bacterium]
LWILKTIRPDFDIATNNSIFIPPPEIVQIAERQGLVESVHFHPSLMERLRSKIERMNPAQKRIFSKVVATTGPTEGMNDRLLLEAVLDHLAIRRHRHRGELPKELAGLERTTLLERSKLEDRGESEFLEALKPDFPHAAHAPMRLQLGLAFDNEASRRVFKIRPALHGLLDREAGYLKNSSIEILELELRSAPERSIYLERVILGSFSNFNPANFYEAPLSWGAEGRLQREGSSLENGDTYFVETDGRVGYSVEFGGPRFLAYGMLAIGAKSRSVKPYGLLEAGPQAGLIFSSGKWKLNTQVEYAFQGPQSEVPALWRLAHQQRFEISKAWAWLASYRMERTPWPNFRAEQIQFSAGYYF